MNSKRKGKRGELEWAAFCRKHGYACRRTGQYCANTADASDVVGLPGVHQEVKRVERLDLTAAMEQAKRDACGGCFNHIPPQRQLDIRSNKKIIVCEYCGRILVSNLLDQQEKPEE